MRFWRALLLLAILIILAGKGIVRAQQGDFLSDDEEDALRDAQDPSLRIVVYLKLQQARLEKIQDERDDPVKIHTLLSQYISLNGEMKNWIQDQYDRHGDMRKGLRALLDQGPQQLDVLRGIGMWPQTGNSDYARDLRDAEDSMTDALNGGTQALADQQKMFGHLKRERKVEAREAKQRAKEEKKRNREEKKLRKKMERQSKAEDNDN